MKDKLQKKFIGIVMTALILIMSFFVLAINGINYVQTLKRMDKTINFLLNNREGFPKPEKGQFPFQGFDFNIPMNEDIHLMTRYYKVEYNKSDQVVKINNMQEDILRNEDLLEITNRIMEEKKESGFIGTYRFGKEDLHGRSNVILIDAQEQVHTVVRFGFITVAVSILTLLLLLMPVALTSKKAIAPIIENIEKQKTFIADASHEIKTPLAIISANADVIELTSGESEWLSSIRNQINRLDKLVKSLLLLAKMEQGSHRAIALDVDFSHLVRSTVESFCSLIEKSGKNLKVYIEEDNKITGQEDELIQVVSILLDNSLKYSDEMGEIIVELKKNKKSVHLIVKNTMKDIENYSKEDLNKLFDRFYRGDPSRARETGGYGIGLSIAKSIVENHKGKIWAQKEGSYICFCVKI